MTLDPLAEKYAFQSPYVYAANSPILFIDYMGMNPDPVPYMKVLPMGKGTMNNNLGGYCHNTLAKAYNGVAGLANYLYSSFTDPGNTPTASEVSITSINNTIDFVNDINPGTFRDPNVQTDVSAAVLGTVAGYGAAKLLKGPKVGAVDDAVEVTVSRSKYPQAAQHIDDAANNGVSTTGTIDRAGASARRRAAIKNTSTKKGMDRDEVPPAVINNGGEGSSVRLIDMGDNRGAGASIGHQIKDLPDGVKVTVTTSD